MKEFYVDPDIASAKTLHASFYKDQEVFNFCREHIFASSWQFVGHTGLVAHKGDVHPFTLLGSCLDEPLILTRDTEDRIHLMSNVCTHRGNLLSDAPCNTATLRCKYHGRQFALDGKFLFMPEFREVKDFPAEADNLKTLPVFRWADFLFTSVSPAQRPEVFFGDMIKRVEWMPLDKFVYRPELTKKFHVKAHWALYCENYLEGFHIPFVHPDLSSVVDFGSYSTELFFPYSSLQLGLSRNASHCFDLPPSSPDFGKQVAAYYFWVFPNMMFNFYPWGLSVNIVEPLSTGESRVIFMSYVWDESKMDAGAGSGLDQVEVEDEEIVENVQKGVRSRFYEHGRYSVTRERGTHHFHRIISQIMNK